MRRMLLLGSFFSVVFVAAAPAGADEPVPVVKQGYATSSQFEDLLLSEGGLPVAHYGGSEKARSYVLLDVQVGEASATLHMQERQGDPTIVAADTAELIACPLTAPFSEGAQRGDPPKEDCTVSVAGTRSETGLWTFDLLPILLGRAPGAPNHGLAIRPAGLSATATFRVVFDPAETSASSTADFPVGPPLDGTGSVDGPPATGPPTAPAAVMDPPARPDVSTVLPPGRPRSEVTGPSGAAGQTAVLAPLRPPTDRTGGTDRLPLAVLVLAPAGAAAVGFLVDRRSLTSLPALTARLRLQKEIAP